MSDATETKDPLKAIELLATNADMLEQTATHFKDITTRTADSTLAGYLGYEVTSGKGGYELQYKGQKVSVQNPHTYRDETSYDALTRRRDEIMKEEVAAAQQALNEAGYVAHVAHLDKRDLSTREKNMLGNLPHSLEQAALILEGHASRTRATPENKAALVQAKRDSIFLRKFSGQIGEDAPLVTQHNESMIDREAELLGAREIAASHAAKFKRGVELLDASHKEASDKNRAYRERVGKRKPLDVLILDPAECKGSGRELA